MIANGASDKACHEKVKWEREERKDQLIQGNPIEEKEPREDEMMMIE